jgi:uncharacterized membrane protein YphA (DoxX/SURF4 family)
MSGSTADFPTPHAAKQLTPGWQSRTLSATCRALLAVAFLAAGASKATDQAGFADRLILHSGLSTGLATLVAASLPWLELTCGFCLVLGVAVREAALIAGVLLVTFLGYSLVHFGERDCNCFFFPGTQPLMMQGWWPLARNLVLLLCTVRLTVNKTVPQGA